MSLTPQSWVFGANDPEIGRGINHLPFTCFVDEAGERRLAVGIGACLLDLAAAGMALPLGLRSVLAEPTLNHFMSLGPEAWQELRARLQQLLSTANKDRAVVEAALVPVRDARLVLPATVGDYTDFYASRHHAERVGALFRPERPLLENYDWVPIAYHGRSSSLVPSGTPVRRPWGQRRGDTGPVFAATEKLDYELELGFYIGKGNALGEPIAIGEAESHVFGVSLLNDWSARDIQAWEYQPLGPFLGKNFCTSVSPWITPMAALAGVRVAAQSHPDGLLDYLQDDAEAAAAGMAIELEVRVAGRKRCSVNSRELFWTPSQMVAHHTVNGCNLRAGDLLGSGTISGASMQEAGCLLEQGTSFLKDGDEVVFTGCAKVDGEMPVVLGECRGTVMPSHPAA